jgi:hypothetical protein
MKNLVTMESLTVYGWGPYRIDTMVEPVVVLIHTCKHELSPAHLVCPWRHNP